MPMSKREGMNRTYSSPIGSTIEIIYSVAQEENQPVTSINAIVKDKDKRVGAASFEWEGALGITLGKGLTREEREAILLDMLKRSEEIFKES